MRQWTVCLKMRQWTPVHHLLGGGEEEGGGGGGGGGGGEGGGEEGEEAQLYLGIYILMSHNHTQLVTTAYL